MIIHPIENSNHFRLLCLFKHFIWLKYTFFNFFFNNKSPSLTGPEHKAHVLIVEVELLLALGAPHAPRHLAQAPRLQVAKEERGGRVRDEVAVAACCY